MLIVFHLFLMLTDRNSLHSCILVNKEWCSVVVPILWKEYSYTCNYSWKFNEINDSEKKLFNTILSCLSSSSNQFLSDNDIKLPSTIFSKTPLFNYVSFCKFPDYILICKIAIMIFGEDLNPAEYPKENLLIQEVHKLFVSQCKNIKELQWKTSEPLSLFPGASACFSQLYRLCID